MIYLRACYIVLPDEDNPMGYAGVMLPDGRFVFNTNNGATMNVLTQEQLERAFPGVNVHFNPHADAAINEVEPS